MTEKRYRVSSSLYRNPLSLMVGAGVAVALLAANVAVTSKNIQALKDDTQRVAETYQTIASLEGVVSLAKDAETGQRGFIITGDAAYLDPYYQAVAKAKAAIATVDLLLKNDPRQQSQIVTLRDSLDKKLNKLAQTIALRQNAGFEAAQQMVLTNQGKQEMDNIRAVVDEMVRAERVLLVERSRQATRAYQTAVVTSLLSGLLALGALIAFLTALRKYLDTRDRADATISEQAENLRTTLQSIGDAVITTDASGAITNLNPVAESLTGWTNQEAIGQPLERIFRIVNEATRQTAPSPAARALSEGTIVGLANHTILIAQGGFERPIDDSAAPIRAKSGAIAGCVLVFRDVSERRSQEKQLRISEQRFRQIADTMPQIVWVTRPDGYHEYYNRRWYEYTGLTAEESIGSSWNNPLHPADRQLSIDRWNHSLQTGEPYEIEYRFRSQAGDYRWFLGRALPVRDEAGQIIRWFGTCTDIDDAKRTATERSKLAADLAEADRRKDEFLATLAHELRNPLAPIRNGLQILRLTGQQSGQVNQATERVQTMMERQLTQMVRLIDELMDISRISRGKVELRREPVEISAVIEQAVETSRPAIEQAEQVLTVTLPPQPIYLQADGVRLVQVFSNLLNNACKYSEPGSEIFLTVKLDAVPQSENLRREAFNNETSDNEAREEVVISIRDTGIGISADMLPEIFELFTQVKGAFERASGQAATPTQGGLGIGLTLVKQLVEMHGGSVRAGSEGLGQGSEFVVRLPTIIEQRQTAENTGSKPQPMNARRILIVDDNEDSAMTLSMLFEMTGDETQTAHDGLKALAAAETFQPDVALLDIGLPEISGYDVARKIREQPWGKTMVLVALTGWGQVEDRQKSKEAGFDGHMVKPVDHEALLKLLDELLA